MVSKNNQWNKMQQEADRVPHYGLRKLSVGVASVLLSTTLLFGMASTAHADNAPSNTAASATTSTSSAGDTDVQSEGEPPAQHNAPVASGVGDETATTPEMQTFTVPQASSPVSKQALAESKAEKTTNINFLDENNDYKDTVTVETGNDVQVNFQTNDYVDGDKFTFKIHPSSDGIDISNTYNLTPADNQKNKATVSEVSENVNEYEFSDTMKGSGTYNQIIAIKTNGTFDPTVVRKDGTYEIAVDVYKNGQKIKNTTFKQIVHHKLSIHWQYNNGENDSLHNIYTMDHQYVSNGQILPNIDYQWRLTAGINPIFNQGTTLTIPVPKHFVLNEAQTKANSPEWFKDYGHLSIIQDGNNVVITFPKINDAQLKELKLSKDDSSADAPYKHDFYIVGKIDQKAADKTTVSGADDITIKNESDHASTEPLKAVLLGTNNTIENTPIGDLLAGNITPDKHNEKLHKYFPDQPEWITTKEDSDKGIHALNRNVSISSQANETLNGVDATVIVPDGMNISTIVNNDTSDANPAFQYEYTDGSKSDKFTKDNIPTAPAGKFIKNIHVHSDKVDPFHKMFSIDLMGVLAKQYRGDNNGTAEKTDKSQPAKGDKVSNLDQLITKIALTLPDSKTNPKHDPTSNDSVWYQGQIVLDKNPDTNIHFNQNEAEANQPSKQAGATGGTLTITQLDVQDEVPNLTYHVILPINAVLNPDNPISNLPKNATVSYFDVNGRTVVKIQIKGGKREDIINKPFTLHLDNAAVINNKTLKSYWDVYVTVPDGQKSYDSFDTDNPSFTYDGYPRDEEDLKTDAFVENNKNSYWAYTSNHEWRLVTATVTQTTTEAVGNLLPSYAAVGKSDDKGSMDMKFSSTIMNADSNDVTHLTTILRMPNTEDGKSEFNFNLQKPVRVLDVATGQEVTDGVQIFYTTKEDYKSKKMENISKDDWQNDFTNSIPADPSTVTAVAVKIAKVPTQAFYRVVAEGTDPTLRNDAGKTAYVANKIWSDQLLPKNVEVGKTSTDDDTSLSAKITVFGESHIKVKFRYQKPDGSYEYINGDDLVLEDNKDTLKKEDLFKKVLGIDSDTLKKYNIEQKDINKLNDIPEFRQELTNRYPGLSDYAIDFTKPSDPSNPNGGDVAKWGDTSTWYFDGNQVTFDLTKLQNSSPNVTLSRETTFVSSKDGSKLKEPLNEPNIDTDSLDISYDPLTQDYIVYDISNHLSYKEYDPKDDVSNYKLDPADAKLDGPSHTDIQKVLEDNRGTLFESSHQHGMRVDITKDEKGQFKASEPVEDDSLEPGNISVVYHQVAHYNPKVNVSISREIDYVSNATGISLQDTTKKDNFNSTTISTEYDQNTNELTNMSNVPDNFDYSKENAPEIGGYTVDPSDSELTGPQDADIQKILSDNQEQLFNSKSEHGFKVEVTKVGDKYTSKVTEDDSLEPGNISVVYHQVAHYNPKAKISISREIDYVSNATGKSLQNPAKKDNFNSATITTDYDKDSHKINSIGNVGSDFDYSKEDAPTIDGYTVDPTDSELTGPQDADIQKILTDNQDQLFNAGNKHGFKVEVIKDGDKYTSNVVEDDSLEPGNISVVYHQVAHYNPTFDVEINREVDSVSAIDGTSLQDPKNETGIASGKINVSYDPQTHEVMTNGTKLSDNIKYDPKTPDHIPGYATNGSIPAVSTDDINKAISAHSKELFDPKNPTGKTITIDQITGETTVTDNPEAPADKITVNLRQQAKYIPSHANLITMFPGQSNTLEVAGNLDKDEKSTDDINFNTTDADLKKDGYTYKVYYVDGTYDSNGLKDDYKYLTENWIRGLDGYDTLADALKAHQYDESVDDDTSSDTKKNNDGTKSFAKFNTQNFVVIYTPINQKPQDIYITSDNDPYAKNDALKDFAIPKDIVSDKEQQAKLIAAIKKAQENPDADQDALQQMLEMAENGNFAQLYKLSGKSSQFPFTDDNFGSQGFNKWTHINKDRYDEEGNQIPVYPFIDESNAGQSSLNKNSPLYVRNGHYIQKVTLTDKNGSGNKITITHTVDPDKLKENSNFDSDGIGDSAVLNLIDYLTNKDSGNTDSLPLNDQTNSAWTISVDGLNSSTVTTDKDGNKYLTISNGDRFVYNNTEYDGKTDSDPQIINLHFSPIVLSEQNPDSTYQSVTIHYVDVTDQDPMDEETRQGIFNDYGVKLPDGTKYAYNNYNSYGLEIDDEGNDGVKVNLKINENHDGYTYDNSKQDAEILEKLAEKGYYVVQRDKETTGQHNFDQYASDISTHEFNGNDLSSFINPGYFSNQNYYVYLMKGQKVNYKVVLEDKDGNEKETLVPESILGLGQTSDKFSETKSGVDQVNSKTSISDRYQAIIEEMAKKYPNYTVVTKDNPNTKLAQTDEIGADDTFGDSDSTKTIWLVPKYGNVTVHYVDVDKEAVKNPDKKDFTSTDGSEITNQKQTPADGIQYGKDYQNTVWDYAKDGYELATTSLPDGIKGGTIDSPSKDIYVFLKHKHSAIQTQPMTVNETVHYVDQDGKSIKDDSTAKMTLTPQGYYDEHTKKDVITGWKSDLKDSKFPTFDTAINGYDIDKDKTKSTDVTGDYNKVKEVPITVENNQQPKDVDITIHYNQKAETHIHYIDVNGSDKTSGFKSTDGTAIDGHDVDHIGHINDSIFPDGKTPWDYANDGWVLAENPSNVNSDMKLTKDTPHDVYVYLKHGTTDLTSKTIKVTETIHYVDENGNPIKDEKGQPITQVNDQHITLTQTGKKDNVTGDNIPNDWTSDKPGFSSLSFDNKPDGYDVDYVYHNDQDGKKVEDGDSINEISYDPSKVVKTATEDQNVDVYVVLKKQVKTTVHYIDVEGVDKDAKDLTPNDGSTIDNESHNFTVDGHVGDDFSEKLWGYDPNKWEYVTQSPEIKDSKLTDSTPSDLYVYLKHKHSDLTTTHPKTVTETIKYVDQDGNSLPKNIKDTISREITFTPEGYHDDVTDKDIITGWTPSGAIVDDGFDKAETTINGYDLDEAATNSDESNKGNIFNDDKDVAAISVTHKSDNVTITVHYNQKAETHIHYIDVNDSDKTAGFNPKDGTAITGHDVDHVGHINDAIFPDGKTPWNYANDGWVLAENPDKVNKDMTLTTDTPEDIYVYLKHKRSDLQTPSMTVTETVHYVDEDGKSVKPDEQVEMTLTPEGYHDNQTGEDVITGWKSNLTNSEFPTHETQVDGYDVDMTKTAATDVSADHSKVNPVKISVGKDNKQPNNVVITVHYQKKSSVKINYVDVNGLDQDHYQDGKVIENGQHDISLDGHKGDAVFSNGTTPWAFAKDGWKLVKETSPVTSDLTLGDQPREITVYLVHGQTTTKPQEAKEIITETSQTRTINYYDDKTGNPQTGAGSLAGKGAKSITQKLNWKRTPVYDLVDGHLLGFAQLDKDGNPMMSPFGMFLLLPTGDENDPASWTPVSLEQDGKKQSWDKNEFPAVESPDLTKHGYQKDQSKKQHADDKQGQLVEAAAADPSKGNQTQNIFYVHDQTPVTPADEPTYPANAQDKKLTKVTQTRTIHYFDDVSGEKIHDDVVQTITWSRTPVYDAVDGSFIGYAGKDGKVDPALNDENSWMVTSTDSNYPAVKSPAVTGYAKTPSLIRHTADGSGQEVLAANGVPAADDIVVNVYYFHDAEEVMATKTVSETIHYVYKDSGKPAAADKTVKLSFSRSGQMDKVTGKTTWGEWTSNQDFASVTSPTISGYTPDQRMIDAQTVGHDSQDLDFTIYYSKDTVTTPGEDQPTTPETPSPKTYTWTIEYVDENGNKIIPDVQDPTAFHDGDQFDGAKSGYDKATISKDGQTYELVASKHASGSIAGGDVTTTYVYKLMTSEEPGEPATPEKPGKPDTPVVPDQPSQPGDGEPAQPGNPGETPVDKPEEPTHPGTPEEPVTPTTPDTPGDETPSKPVGPSEPNQPGEPTIPDMPATSETPTTPDQPSTAEPGQPAEPGTPGEDVPATPETPVTPTTPSEPDQPSTPVHDGRYMLTIRYQDEDGNKLQPSVTDSNKYQAGEAFNAVAFEQAEITKDGKTYQLVPAKSFNTTGEFSDHSELTIYVYREKGAAPKTTLKLTIKYLDEFGNEIAETVNGGDAFKNGQDFNSNGHLKTTITTADGKVYKLIAKKIYNAVGTFGDSDETTVFIYQLVADGNATSAEPAVPGTPAEEPSQPTNPVTPAEPTGPSTPADPASPAQSTTAGSSASATPVADGQAKATSAAGPAVTKTVADASQSTPAQATAAKQLPQTGNANAKAVMALGIGSLIGALAAGLGLGKKRRQ